MKRPLWTLCFALIWILVVPGVLLVHLSVSKLVPVVKDLPDNVVKGFDEVFKFAYLERDAKRVQSSSESAVGECKTGAAASTAIKAEVSCPSSAYKSDITQIATRKEKMDPKKQKTSISTAFSRSLSIISRVANDKYLGTKELNETANSLNQMSAEFARIPDGLMECAAAVPAFCEIYNAGNAIVQGMADVRTAIDTFKNSDQIKQFKDNASYLEILHGLPYVLVFAMLCFTIFWQAGGVCCCCEQGTQAGWLMIFFGIFWLASVVIFGIVAVTGIVLKFMQDSIPIPVLKGEPSLKKAIEHLQTQYAEFWDIVFEPLEEPLDLMLQASLVFLVVGLLIFFYSCCECCCTPYRERKLDTE